MRLRHALIFCVVEVFFNSLAARPVAAQTPPTSTSPPATLDSQLRSNLGLGNAQGCVNLLAPAGGDSVDDALAKLDKQIGNELRAICFSSAVTSASSLGGGFQSSQVTKSASQFTLPRTRIDDRLKPIPKKPVKPKPDRGFAAMQDTNARTGFEPRAGIFGEVRRGSLNRTGTSYESAYDSDVQDLSVGADVLVGRGLVGGWIGRSVQTGTFSTFTPLSSNLLQPTDAAILAQPGVLSAACGGLTTGGAFDQRATRVGGFAAWGGPSAFVDASYAYTRREYSYARSTCAIEFQGALSFTGGILKDDFHPTGVDTFAGVLSGLAQVHESGLSFRFGADAGSSVVTAGPRIALTWTQSTTGAYTEAGRSTLDKPVTSNSTGLTINRKLGDPIGLELAYDERERSSLQLDLGGEVAGHAGAVSPFFSLHLRLALDDTYPVATAHLVQDRRPSPKQLQFGFDKSDPRAWQYGFGLAFTSSGRLAARIEFSELKADDLFSGRVLAANAHVRF